MLQLSENIIFSTALIPNPIPKIDQWWYYGSEHGQHVAIYSKKALTILGNKFDLYYYNIDNMHIFSKKKIGIFGTLFINFKYSKYALYLLYFLIAPFMKSYTVTDMEQLKSKNDTIQ